MNAVQERRRRLLMRFATAAVVMWLGSVGAAHAQTSGGTLAYTLSSTTNSTMQLPAATTTYPAVMITPKAGNTADIYFAFGASSVTATASSRHLPTDAICINVGSSGYLALFASAATTVYVDQMTACPTFSENEPWSFISAF